jgi:hypothetical protein
MKTRAEKRRSSTSFRKLMVTFRQVRGDHRRWQRLGEFAVEHGRSFDPALDNVVGIYSGVFFFKDSGSP